MAVVIRGTLAERIRSVPIRLRAGKSRDGPAVYIFQKP